MAENIGFIILRHVNNEKTNQYWIHCYECIRKYYPNNLIIIIDDNSNYLYITDIQLYETTIINSEYPGRSELLPYYYYLHNKLFDIAVIIHDSVFINSYIDFNVDEYKFIWEFEHLWDNPIDEIKQINLFNNTELLEFYKNKNIWKGCFGGMSVIKHKYLSEINNKYDISKLLEVIVTKYDRACFERVIACLLQKNGKNGKNGKNKKQTSLFGNIHRYCEWGVDFYEKENYAHLPLIKVWTGR